jgi:serine/threonine protein kinase
MDADPTKLQEEAASISVAPIGPLADGQLVGGKYEILGLLGQGGVGSVYKVNHQALNKIFALKALNPGVTSDEKALRRFDAEAKTVGNLSSPYLIQVHDYGLTDDNAPYLVLDYIEGTNLAEEIARLGHLDERRVLDLFIKVCEGLEHAHSNQIVHRDLKPSNIMLLKDTKGNEIPKIVDFGIAKRQAIDNSMTQTGEIFGTPLYMSPEQCRGKPIDHRSDIYSLGCVMYEALTGVPPLVGTNPVDTVLRHISDSPAPLKKVCSGWTVSPEIEQVVMACLEKDPNRRPASVSNLQENLKRVDSGKKPVVARHLPRLRSQHKGLALTALGILIGVAGIVAVVLWYGFSLNNVSGFEKENALAAAAFGQKQYSESLKLSLSALKQYQKTLSSEQLRQLYFDIGVVYSKLKDPDKAAEFCSKASALAKASGDYKEAFNDLYSSADALDDPMQKIKFNEEAVALWKTAYADQPDYLMHPLVHLIKVYANLQMWDKSEEKLKDALQVIAKYPQTRMQYQLQIYDWYGYVYENTNRLKQAEASFRQAEAIADRLKSPYVKVVRGELKHVLNGLHQNDEADKIKAVEHEGPPSY